MKSATGGMQLGYQDESFPEHDPYFWNDLQAITLPHAP